MIRSFKNINKNYVYASPKLGLFAPDFLKEISQFPNSKID